MPNITIFLLIDGLLATIAGNNSSGKDDSGTFVTNEKGMINVSIQTGVTKTQNNVTMVDKEEINNSSIQDGVTKAPNNQTKIQGLHSTFFNIVIL